MKPSLTLMDCWMALGFFFAFAFCIAAHPDVRPFIPHVSGCLRPAVLDLRRFLLSPIEAMAVESVLDNTHEESSVREPDVNRRKAHNDVTSLREKVLTRLQLNHDQVLGNRRVKGGARG